MRRWVQYAVVSILLIATINIGVLNHRVMEQRKQLNAVAFMSQMNDMKLYHGVVEAHKRAIRYETGIQRVVHERKPSVVAIHALHATRYDPYTQKPLKMSGSGVVISEDGMILTCSHIVDDNFAQCSRVWVVFADGTEREVERVAYTRDRTPDVGVLWIDPNGLDLQPVQLLDMDPLEDFIVQGETVVVMGAPRGYDHSVSAGIVSHPHRTTIDPARHENEFIQVDAPINGGNSGGPVFNLNGELIGIATWTWDGDGLGFVTPVTRILDGLQEMCDPIEVVLAEQQEMEECPPIMIFRF